MTPITSLAAAGASKVASAAIGAGLNMLMDMPKGGNVVAYAEAGTIIPTCLVDESCSTSEILPETLQTLQAVYAGYFLRAFAMHNINVGGASVWERLDKFSTNRNTTNALGTLAMKTAKVALEDFVDALPTYDELASDLPEDLAELEEEGKRIEEQAIAMMMTIATEAQLPNQTKAGSKNAPATSGTSEEASVDGKKSSSVSLEKTVDISAPVNFAVGLTVNVKIQEEDRTVMVPVNIRLNAMYMNPAPLTSILGFSAENISFGERYRKWRLGGIDFWRDLVMCQDLIKEHEKNLRSDKTGIYLQMMNRRRQNALASALTASLSANSASNIVVLSEETAAALEVKTGGRLTDFRFRERIFDQGYGVMMAVISQRRGRVRFYTRGIPEHTEVGERDLKGMAKGSSGPDVGDILAAFRAGSSFRM